MGRPVLSHEPRAVEAQHHGQFLERHVVDHLVVGALHEGGVDVAERLHPRRRETCGEGHGVFLLYADVEEAVRLFGGEPAHAAAVCHGRGYPYHPPVPARQVAEHLAEYVLIAVMDVALGVPFGRFGIESAWSVPCGRILLSRGIALPLERQAVEYARPLYVPEPAQGVDHLFHVVAVYGAEVPESQRLEHVAAGPLDHP